MKLIPKDALVAWAKETYLCENASMIRKVCYKQLVEHLNTLEVKEVDIDKLCEFRENLGFAYPEDASEYQKQLACYRQGIKDVIKAQTGEEV